MRARSEAPAADVFFSKKLLGAFRKGMRFGGVALLLVGMAVGLAVLGFVLTKPSRQDEGALVRQLRQELVEARLQLEQQRALAGHTASRPQPCATPAVGAVVPAATRSYTHTLATIPVRRGDFAMMTYATGGVGEMLHNWVLHIQRIGVPILAIAMDADVLHQCTTQRFDCLDWSQQRSSPDDQYLRGDESGFRKLGVRKVDALVAVLRAGVHVVLSDVDCVWSHDPGPIVRGTKPGYEQFALADVIAATDCMSPEDDFRESGCFNGLMDKNTGVLAVRATPNGIGVMAEWRVRLAVGQKNEQDQTTFMDLIDGNGRGHR